MRPEFVECPQCASKTGAPDLCVECLERRELYAERERVFDLAEFAERVHSNAVAHGWHDQPRTFGDVVALCHSELSEALEAYREPGALSDRMFHLMPGRPPKPDGMLPELADVIIRILDYAGSIRATGQLLESLRLKHAYNASRPYRHGGKNL